MNQQLPASRDLSILSSLKPYLSPQGKEFADLIAVIIRAFPENKASIDAEAFSDLLKIFFR